MQQRLHTAGRAYRATLDAALGHALFHAPVPARRLTRRIRRRADGAQLDDAPHPGTARGIDGRLLLLDAVRRGGTEQDHAFDAMQRRRQRAMIAEAAFHPLEMPLGGGQSRMPAPECAHREATFLQMADGGGRDATRCARHEYH